MPVVYSISTKTVLFGIFENDATKKIGLLSRYRI